MPTANERRALWFLAIVALSGSLVRLMRARPAPGSGTTPDAQLEHQLTRIDSARAQRNAPKRPSSQRGASPRDTLNPERRTQHPVSVDLDRAPAKDIEALPGIGPSLAARIVAYRDSVGTFGTMVAFCRVRGVGPATAARLRSRIVFSGISAENAECKAEPAKQSKSHVTNRGKAR